MTAESFPLVRHDVVGLVVGSRMLEATQRRLSTIRCDPSRRRGCRAPRSGGGQRLLPVALASRSRLHSIQGCSASSTTKAFSPRRFPISVAKPVQHVIWNKLLVSARTVSVVGRLRAFHQTFVQAAPLGRPARATVVPNRNTLAALPK
jgi:hypothetical protein